MQLDETDCFSDGNFRIFEKILIRTDEFCLGFFFDKKIFRRIFFFNEFFEESFLTYNLLTIASIRIRVPPIFFGLGSWKTRKSMRFQKSKFVVYYLTDIFLPYCSW